MSSLSARCRRCEGKLLLAEIVGGGSGRCPSCGELLAPGNSLLLLEEARRADALHRAFIVCLDRLAGLPGNLMIDPDTALRDTVAAVGWGERLAEDRETIRSEAADLPPRARACRRLPRRERRAAAGSLAADIRRVAQRLRHHGDLVERRNADEGADGAPLDPVPLREAAARAEAAAAAVAQDRRLADDRVRDAMDEVRRTMDEERRVEAAGAGVRGSTVG